MILTFCAFAVFRAWRPRAVKSMVSVFVLSSVGSVTVKSWPSTRDALSYGLPDASAGCTEIVWFAVYVRRLSIWSATVYCCDVSMPSGTVGVKINVEGVPMFAVVSLLLRFWTLF